MRISIGWDAKKWLPIARENMVGFHRLKVTLISHLIEKEKK